MQSHILANLLILTLEFFFVIFRDEVPKAVEQKFSIPAESFANALELARKNGESILGATVTLQLKQDGMETIPVQLPVDENLLSQLEKGESINLVLSNPIPENTTISQTVSSHAPPPPPVEIAQVKNYLREKY